VQRPHSGFSKSHVRAWPLATDRIFMADGSFGCEADIAGPAAGSTRWHVESGQSYPAPCIRLRSTDCKRILTAVGDATVSIWNATTDKQSVVLRGHECFRPPTVRTASGSLQRHRIRPRDFGTPQAANGSVLSRDPR
jgi:hypothetical protein